MTDHSLLLWIFSAILTITGLSGLLLPMIPGAPVLFLGLLIGAWADDFKYVGIWTLVVLAAMTGLTYLIEFTASIMGAKRYGGSNRSLVGAAVGGMIGLLFGVPGILIGPFAGAVMGELSLRKPLDEAGRSGFGTVLGLAVGMAGKFAIGIAMVGLFLAVRFI